MPGARNRRLPVWRALLLLGVAGVWAMACGGPQPLGAAGSVCFRADDCQAGLACVPETVGAAKHVCSADLSGIVSMVDGAAPEAGDISDATAGAPSTPQAGSSAYAGAAQAAGAAGKPATGGAPGSAGSAAAGAQATAGAAVGGSPAGGGSAAGAPAAGSSAAGNSAGGAENGGASAGGGG